MDREIPTDAAFGQVTVRCERTGQVVDGDHCISCAGTSSCFPPAYLRLLFLSQLKERSGIHVTDLTGCLRKAFFGKTEAAPPIRPGSMLPIMMGNLVHGALEGHGGETERKVSMTLDGVTIVGSVDAVDGGIVEYKTTRWLKVGNLPYGNHKTQVLYYAVLLREMGEPVAKATIFYLDLSGPSRCPRCKREVIDCACGYRHTDTHRGVATFPVLFSDSELDEARAEMLGRAKALHHALEQGIAPSMEKSWLCRYCDFKETCDASRAVIVPADTAALAAA